MISEQALKDRIQTIAREKGIHFNTCWKQLVLERFLARLSSSPHSHKFIFKGGFLLAYLMKIGRETVDLDFLLTRMKVEENELREVIEQMISASSSDGFAFSFSGIELLQQPHMEYPGYRVTLKTAFGKMRDKVQVDVGIGDIVEPVTRKIQLIQYRGKSLFEEAVSIPVYPVETIFAEKLETIISKGVGNSRMKDYHDLILLIQAKGMLELNKLQKALFDTFTHRSTALQFIEFDAGGIQALQKLWTAHLRGLGVQDLPLPKEITVAIQTINQFLTTLKALPIRKEAATIEQPN